MVTEDDVRSRLDHGVSSLDVVLTRRRVELHPPMDGDDDEIRHVLGSGHGLDHRWSVISVPHPGRVGGCVPAVIGGDSAEADHSHLPPVDVVQRRLPASSAFRPAPTAPIPAARSWSRPSTSASLPKSPEWLFPRLPTSMPLASIEGRLSGGQRNTNALSRGEPRLDGNTLEIGHSEVIIQQQPVQPRPGVIPPLGGEGRNVSGSVATSPVPWIIRYPFSGTAVGVVVVMAGGSVVVGWLVVTPAVVDVEVSTAAATVDGVVAASVLRLQMVKATTPVRTPPIERRAIGKCESRTWDGNKS